MSESAELRVSLSPDGQGLRITFPSGHEVEARAQSAGALLFNVLKEREGRGASAPFFGTSAEPTQRMVEDFLAKGGKITKIAKLKPPPEGLSFEDLFSTNSKENL